jgi:hypothetical protein
MLEPLVNQSREPAASTIVESIHALDYVETHPGNPPCGSGLDLGDSRRARPKHQQLSFARGLRRYGDQPDGQYGLEQPHDPLCRQFRRVHAVSHGRWHEQLALFLAARELGAGIGANLVPTIAHVKRSRDGLGSRQRIARSFGITGCHAVRRWSDESTDRSREQYERHAAQFRLSLLSAPQPDFARLAQSWHVDVTFEQS